jgi:SepF-like predicted cell division protein (DUF552 family)
MGLFDKVLGKGEVSGGENLDLQDLIENAGDSLNPPADFYVKRIDLRNEGDSDLVIKELTAKNIIILNVLPIAKQPNRLKGIIGKLKHNAVKSNGDIALLSESTLILTPGNVKIMKSKPKPVKQ